MKLTPLQQAVYNLLPRGSQRPRTQAEIASLIESKPDVRTIAEVITQLIKLGIPVGSSRAENSGHYLIETEEERTATVKPLSQQASAEMSRINALMQIDLADFWTKEKPHTD
ncbi:hypothetical protein [Pediococcus pentosaceus]|uniref:hypothetical protein n=1 Tax=Pediococcus pentosaceus TaxID=1255 RepID=UPI003982A0F2